jgi:hypothetical protein
MKESGLDLRSETFPLFRLIRYTTDGIRMKQAQKDGYLKRGFYVYDLRDNEPGYTIEPFVLVNHIGVIITDAPIDFALAKHEINPNCPDDKYMTDDEFAEIYDAREVLLEELLTGGDAFADDEDKMRDFYKMPKDEFLAFYSYLTEADYDATVAVMKEDNLQDPKEAK